MRLLLIGAVLSHMPAFSAEPERPRSGQTVDERREVALRTAVSSPCLAFPIDGATVLLQKSELEDLAGAVHDVPPTPDSEMLQLNRDRAMKLLQADFTAGSLIGCALARSVPGDSGYLVLRQIELGQAAVVADGAAQLAPQAVIRHFGIGSKNGGGFITVFLPGKRRPICSLRWWFT